MPNPENLKKGVKFKADDEVTKQKQIKGGIESGKTRRLQGALRELLDKDVTIDGVKKMLDEMGIDKKDRRWSKAVTAAMLKKAAEGDKACADWVRDTAGEKPTDKQEIEYGANTIEAITAGMSVKDKQKEIEKLLDGFKVGGSE